MKVVGIELPGPEEWHARLVIGHAGSVIDAGGLFHDWLVITTPDGDAYVEDIGAGSAEVADIRDRPADRAVPDGIDPAAVYDFAAMPTAGEMRILERGMVEASEP